MKGIDVLDLAQLFHDNLDKKKDLNYTEFNISGILVG